MKSLSKLHAEAVLMAKTEQEKVKAAAVAMVERPVEMIRAILLKHEQAVIEVMCELQEAKDAAVLKEREANAKVLDEMADYMESEMELSTAVAWVRSKAAEIRARSNT